ncbi:cupin protein [Medicago truncatula]|uniref:Cupin protein n=1 Tax=Medicago truncatula TaxID=3880 RepID=G7JQN7_MEDTR|nr:cupin protein [Medicago truncatula]
MILPNTGKEVVLKLKQGDIVTVPIGAVSWWFNDGDSDLNFILVTNPYECIL